jgi:colanic acid biosynthesis glycosyl transferase WcaI
MLTELASALGARHEVAVITSRQLYENPARNLPAWESMQRVSVHRVWSSRFGRGGLLGRSVAYATFYLASAWRLGLLARAGDVVIAKTDPPMLSVIAGPICWLRRASFINWLQDIFPETAEVLKVGGFAGRVGFPLLRQLRNWSLKRAVVNVVLGERMAERVCALGVPKDRIRPIPNWANGKVVVPMERDANPLRAKWGFGDAFVVGYSGNLGRAHEIDTFLEAMKVVEKATAGVLWLFVGSGALFARLQAEVARQRLASVRFEPYQPQALLAQSLSVADLHLVSLRPELEGLIVPSKFYGIAAAGRPTLFVGSKDGEIATLLARFACGRTIEPGNGVGLAHIILELAAKPTLCRELGERARAAFDAEFDRPIAVARWERVFAELNREECRS